MYTYIYIYTHACVIHSAAAGRLGHSGGHAVEARGVCEGDAIKYIVYTTYLIVYTISYIAYTI